MIPLNLCAVSDKHGRADGYQGRWDESIMSDWRWFLQREDSTLHLKK